MNLLELFVKIGADTKDVEKGMAQAKKSAAEYKKDVMNLAQTYKKQGMDMSSAMKRAYSEIDKSQYETSESAKKHAKSFSINWGNAAAKLKTGLVTAAKIGTAAIGVAASAIAALTTASIKSYAEYEQLVGGVDTLFKNSSAKLQAYANDAYKTAGMSANDYMQNATSFSAALIQSLNGDTDAAAEAANRAMISMSDNANKMGTSIESIVQTYQSLSRGNFAMLDNLKLGYGGTKTELERLIKDAASYTDIQKEMGITVDASSMSFANIVNAIAVVQGKLGIAGATAQEAASTIEGSLNSTKAAWKNLVAGVANENADLEKLIGNFVESAGTALENLLPRIGAALNGASKLVRDIVPVIVQEIPVLIEQNLPVLAEAAVGIVQSLVDGIGQSKDTLFATALDVILYLANSFVSMLPQILQVGLDLIVSLALGIAEALPELMPTIVDVILQIVDTLTAPEQLSQLLSAALTLIIELANGLMDAIPQLVKASRDIINNFTLFLMDPKNIAMILNAALQVVIALGTGLINSIPALVQSVGELVAGMVDKIKNTDWGQVGRDVVDGLLTGLKNAWGNIKSWFSSAWNSLFGNNTVNVTANTKTATKIDGSHALGLDYVPFNGYIAELHKGERVLTADEAKRYNSGVTVVQNIYSQAKTAADLMQESIYQQRRAVLLGV